MQLLYTHSTDDAEVYNTPKYQSCAFKIQMANRMSCWPPMYGEKNGLNKKYIDEIHGIADETGSFGYSTVWGEGPGAKFVSKIQGFTRAKAFKLFGGSSFDNNVATGKWTQKYPSDGSQLSFSLKFRAYRRGLDIESKKSFLNTSSYMTIIPFLSYACSAMHEFDFSSELKNIANALTNAKQAGEDFGQKISDVIENNEISASAAEDLIAEIDNLIAKLSTSSPSQVLFLFGFGDSIKMSTDVQWMIDSFSFTPSTEMDKDNYPLWCDFDVSLKTNQKLSNTQLSHVLG